MLSLEDISKIPRLPGDGAQDNTYSKFDESNKAQLESSRPSIASLRDNVPVPKYSHSTSK